MQTKVSNVVPRSQKGRDGFGQHLQNIARYPIPTLEQEQEWGATVQAWIRVKNDESLRSTISTEEYARLERNGMRAKDKMISGNIRLAVAVAKKFQNRGVDLEDLIQEGSIGLDRAVEKFNPALGWKFSTYATWWVRQAITRAISQQCRTIRLPVHVMEKLNKVKKARRLFVSEFGRTPSLKDLENYRDKNGELMLTPAELATINDPRYRDSWSFDAPLNRSSDELNPDPISDMVKDPNANPIDYVESEEFRDSVEVLLSQLSEREQVVIKWRYGIDGTDDRTLNEVGNEIGLTRERVRQIQAKAVDKLRRKVRDQAEDWKLNLEN